MVCLFVCLFVCLLACLLACMYSTCMRISTSIIDVVRDCQMAVVYLEKIYSPTVAMTTDSTNGAANASVLGIGPMADMPA